jgi:hypothetical protein
VKAISTACLILSLTTLSAAQNKISGTVQCSKPDQQQSMDVGDHPNHSFNIEQGKCTWTQSLEIAGAKSKEDSYTSFSEVNGKMSHTHGYVVGTWDSGDKTTVRTQGAMPMSGGKPVSESGTWTFVSGTGKLKGIKGRGTYQAKPEGENMIVTVEGEYELPQ